MLFSFKKFSARILQLPREQGQGNSKAGGQENTQTQDTGKEEGEGNQVDVDSETRYTTGHAPPGGSSSTHTTSTRKLKVSEGLGDTTRHAIRDQRHVATREHPAKITSHSA